MRFCLFLRERYRRGITFWEEKSGLRFNCLNNKRIWFLRHCCEDNGYYDYKLTDFFLKVIESDSPFEITVCDIASNKQIKTSVVYNLNGKSVIDFTKIYNKSEVSLYCRKYDHNFTHKDQY